MVGARRLALGLDVVPDLAQREDREAVFESELDRDLAAILGEVDPFGTRGKRNPVGGLVAADNAVLAVVAGRPPGQAGLLRVGRVVTDRIGFERDTRRAGAREPPFQAVRDLSGNSARDLELELVRPRAVVAVAGLGDALPVSGETFVVDVAVGSGDAEREEIRAGDCQFELTSVLTLDLAAGISRGLGRSRRAAAGRLGSRAAGSVIPVGLGDVIVVEAIDEPDTCGHHHQERREGEHGVAETDPVVPGLALRVVVALAMAVARRLRRGSTPATTEHTRAARIVVPTRVLATRKRLGGGRVLHLPEALGLVDILLASEVDQVIPVLDRDDAREDILADSLAGELRVARVRAAFDVGQVDVNVVLLVAAGIRPVMLIVIAHVVLLGRWRRFRNRIRLGLDFGANLPKEDASVFPSHDTSVDVELDFPFRHCGVGVVILADLDLNHGRHDGLFRLCRMFDCDLVDLGFGFAGRQFSFAELGQNDQERRLGCCRCCNTCKPGDLCDRFIAGDLVTREAQCDHHDGGKTLRLHVRFP